MFGGIGKIVEECSKALGGTVKSEYEGEFNPVGQREGRGVARYSTGAKYEGEARGRKHRRPPPSFTCAPSAVRCQFRAGEKEGQGCFTFADGAVYEGAYRAGEQEGSGSYLYTDLRAEVLAYRGGAEIGSGVRWSVDRQTAWLMVDGEVTDEIMLDEALDVATRLGCPVPVVPPSLYTGARNAAGQPEGSGTFRGVDKTRCPPHPRPLAPRSPHLLLLLLVHALRSRLLSRGRYTGEWRANMYEGRGIFKNVDRTVYDVRPARAELAPPLPCVHLPSSR